ncbi:uncharacterized protein EAE97_011877 [Botrytis byssoidea]|uniref:Uncharacterized protein n=1 Tax=Botrytis byssoidea TaxID=139641 RepID=A0A9P5HZ27_9HELO|nr:uncharacterized protein EAE97_011877 [Botrytis byssoidea]KAF7918422.1 hypothetical protein EAE97_011877 [Botrytis byssoidea]
MLPRKLSIFISFFRFGLDFQHFLILLTCIGITCLVLLPLSYTTRPTPTIYLLSLSPTPPLSSLPSPITQTLHRNITSLLPPNTQNSSLIIRTGYRGICMTSELASSRWECAQRVTKLKDIITTMTTDTNIDIDPLNLLKLAESVRKRIVFDGLLYISLALTLLLLLLLTLIPRWKTDRNPDTASERQVKAFPSRVLSITLGLISGFAFLFAFTSILWQHLTAVTASRFIERMSYGSVVARVGTDAMVIGWLVVLMLWFAFMGCLLMLSLRKVRRTFG